MSASLNSKPMPSRGVFRNIMTGKLLCLALLFPCLAGATVHLPHLFSHGMGLQRDQPVPFWGWAEPGESVTVEFAEQVKPVKADATGKWQIALDPLPASAAPRTLRINSASVTNVLVGDVFLCSGQSNMAMSMEAARRYPGTAEDIQSTSLPAVRFFQAPNATFRETPQEDVEAKWEPVAPANNAHLSAVAFYFAKSLHAHLQVPLGILRASHGGGSAEIKMPREALLSVPSGKKFYEDAIKRASPESVAARNRIFQERYEAAVRDAKAKGAKPPEPPKPVSAVDGGYPCSDWNGVIAPIIPYAKRGIVWYQGEHNAGRAFAYREIFPALIRSWRAASGQPGLPFLFVQLPAYDSPGKSDDWATLRESMLVTLQTVTNTAMIVTIDHGERDNIHPADKQPVGERLALEARRLIYGQPVTGCGPLYARFTVDGANLVVRFRDTGVSPVSLSATTTPAMGGTPMLLSGFTLAGEDRKFVAATAVIRGNTVVLSSPAVPKPVAARYAWANWPQPSLFDAQGLPASPFRTDDWEK
ncbi:MAG: sialate O-acetylesterase [Verrucomicrobiota bacterium]